MALGYNDPAKIQSEKAAQAVQSSSAQPAPQVSGLPPLSRPVRPEPEPSPVGGLSEGRVGRRRGEAAPPSPPGCPRPRPREGTDAEPWPLKPISGEDDRRLVYGLKGRSGGGSGSELRAAVRAGVIPEGVLGDWSEEELEELDDEESGELFEEWRRASEALWGSPAGVEQPLGVCDRVTDYPAAIAEGRSPGAEGDADDLGNKTPENSTSSTSGLSPFCMPCGEDCGSSRKLPTLDIEVPQEPTPQERRDFLEAVQRHFQDMGWVEKRVCNCGRRASVVQADDDGVIPEVNTVSVWRRPVFEQPIEELVEDAVVEGMDVAGYLAHYRGRRLCGHQHACIRCGRRKAKDRVRDLARVSTAHLEQGGFLYLVTLTVPHIAEDNPRLAVRMVIEAFSKWAGGGRNGMLHRRWGTAGWCRALEVTYTVNGPHVHVHVLLFRETAWPGGLRSVDGSPDQISDRLLDFVGSGGGGEGRNHAQGVWWLVAVNKWLRIVKKLGPKILGRELRPLARAQHFCSVPSASKLSSYLAKAGYGVAYELGYSQAKVGRVGGSRTPFQIAVDVALEGRPEDLELLQAHFEAMRGCSVLTRSRKERDPFKWYADAPVPDLETDGTVLGEPEKCFEVEEWLYCGLWRNGDETELLRQVERLGPELVSIAVGVAHLARVGLFYPNFETADIVAEDLILALKGRAPP